MRYMFMCLAFHAATSVMGVAAISPSEPISKRRSILRSEASLISQGSPSRETSSNPLREKQSNLLWSTVALSLEQIGKPEDMLIRDALLKYGTDKEREHAYSGLYEVLLGDRKSDALRILEIGLGTQKPGAVSAMGSGSQRDASLYAWREYFPNAKVYGLDIQDDVMLKGEDRIRTALADSTTADGMSVRRAFEQFGCTKNQRCFDVSIDDGLHTASGQISTLKNVFPYLECGGMHIIEDIEYSEREPFMARIGEVRDIAGSRSSFFFARDFPSIRHGVKDSSMMIIKKNC